MSQAVILRRMTCGLLEAAIGSVTLDDGQVRFGVVFTRTTPPLTRGTKDTRQLGAHFPPAAVFSYGDLLPLAKLARLSHEAIDELFRATMPDLGGSEPIPPSIVATGPE